ncbi:MAG: efflux RND transporter periplasmic adaptor subunit [Balneolales bacterium]
MRNYLILPTCVLLIAWLSGCENNTEDSSTDNQNNGGTREVAVEAIIVESGEFRSGVKISGTVESINDAIISAEASGRVQEIISIGSEVQAGDVIAQLDKSILRSSLEVARSNFEVAEETYERQQPLFEEGIITPLEFSGVRARREQARAQLRQAEIQLENATITAPFNGRVEQRMVETGELLNPGNAVVRLVNIDKLKITAGLPDRYSNDVRVGSEVMVDLSAYNAGELESEVTFTGNVINTQTRTFPIEIEIDNSERLMKPQMTVDLLVTHTTLPDVISVPRNALIRDETGQNVFVINREGERPVAEYRPVTTGESTAGNVLIHEGLFDGDEVIVAGLANLNVGDIVRVE